MALVGEVVARFRAETSDYMQKLDQAKQKNRELATQLLATAGTADKAIASLQVARNKGGLAEFGLDKREVSGLIASIREIDKESRTAKGGVDDLTDSLNKQAKRAGGLHDIGEAFDKFASGDFLKGIQKLKKGMADLRETAGADGAAIGNAFNVAIAGMIGKALADATSKINEHVTALRQGKEGYGDLADGALKAIPVFGSFYQAALNVREIITGENAAFAAQIKVMEGVIATHEQYRKAKAKREETAKEAAQGTSDLNVASDVKARRTGGLVGTADFDEITAKYNADTRKFVEEINNSAKDEIAALKDKQNQLKPWEGQEYEAIQRTIDAREKSRDALIRERMQANAAAFEQDWRAKHGDKTATQVDVEAFGKKLFEGVVDRFKGSPIVDWVKDQLKKGEKEIERLKQKAEDYRAKIQTPAQKLGMDLQDAKLAGLSGGELDALATKDAKDLLKEQKKIMESETSLYEFSGLKELRGGQTLYAPPTRIEEQQLERLGEIRDALNTIKSFSDSEGFVVEELRV